MQGDYDIVIAGGGMIGASLALALAPLGLRVAVVEAVSRGAPGQPSFDDRSTALSRSSRRMFEAMGLWEAIAEGATPIRHIHVSERGRFGFSHIDAAEQGVDALGYVVVNRVLGGVLQSALAGAGPEVACPARITGVRTRGSKAIATIEEEGGPQEVTCGLLIAADGSGSTVRSLLGIGVDRRDYRQRAVIGNLEPEHPHENRAFERFLPGGALALLPLGDDRSAFVWAVPEAAAARLTELSDRDFGDRLQDAFGTRLGRFARVGRSAVYPLTLSRARRLAAPRCVLVGNAAHGLHPVAAQGFNLGLRDAAALAECIADAMREGGAGAIGDDRVLDAYAAWRRADHRKVVQFTDGLVRLFGAARAPVPALRNAGMLAFDLIPGARALFARHAMGLAGRLPRLSRGVPLE